MNVAFIGRRAPIASFDKPFTVRQVPKFDLEEVRNRGTEEAVSNGPLQSSP